MLAYRIALKPFSQALVAPGFAGRWNSEGRRVIYCADSIALAFLESMIRRQGVGFNNNFAIMVIDIPDTLKTDTIEAASLPKDWRDFRNYEPCQQRGNQWYDAMSTAVLRVPSAVLPLQFNFVLNALHPDFKKIRLAHTSALLPDERIEALLKDRS